jgi:eukaryotic-like serine/threonine-protein kinase
MICPHHRIRRAAALIVLLMSACQALPPSLAEPTQVALSATAPLLDRSLGVPTAASAALPAPDTPTPAQILLPPVLWSFQTEGAIWGAPALNEGLVYIGSDDGNLYAIDADSGTLRWKFATRGLVRSRPAISNRLVYFASDDGFLYGVEAGTGKQVWRTDIHNFSANEARENPGLIPDPTIFDYKQSSPVASEGRLYVGSADGNVYALAADTGRIMWSFKTGQKVRATPTLHNGVVHIGSWDGTVYALDASTGEARWKTPIGGQIQTTALVADGVVYTASRKASVVALDEQTGQKKWEFYYGPNKWVESSPQLAGNLVYVGSSANQYVNGLDSGTGELLSAYRGEALFWSTPAIADDTLYIGGEAYTKTSQIGGLFSLEIPQDISFRNRAPIRLKWQFPVPNTLMPDGNWAGVASSPVISGNVIYFGGLDGKLYAVAIGP